MERNVLRRLWLNYGEAVVLEPAKLRAHLLDEQLPKKNINLLLDISRLNYFKEFMTEITTDESAADRLMFNAKTEYAFTDEAVSFGARCWVYCFTGDSYEHPTDFEHDDGESKMPRGLTDSDNLSEEDAKFVASAIRDLMK